MLVEKAMHQDHWPLTIHLGHIPVFIMYNYIWMDKKRYEIPRARLSRGEEDYEIILKAVVG